MRQTIFIVLCALLGLTGLHAQSVVLMVDDDEVELNEQSGPVTFIDVDSGSFHMEWTYDDETYPGFSVRFEDWDGEELLYSEEYSAAVSFPTALGSPAECPQDDDTCHETSLQNCSVPDCIWYKKCGSQCVRVDAECSGTGNSCHCPIIGIHCPWGPWDRPTIELETETCFGDLCVTTVTPVQI